MPVSRAEKALNVAPGELSQMERYLLIVIAIASRKSPLATTQAELAKLASVSSNTVQRTLPKLKSKRLIRLRRQQFGRGIPDETLIWLLLDNHRQQRRQTTLRKQGEDPAASRPGFYPSKPRPKGPRRLRPKGQDTQDLFRG